VKGETESELYNYLNGSHLHVPQSAEIKKYQKQNVYFNCAVLLSGFPALRKAD